ncbi:hypothetical protein L9F63_025018, partial [Diploptera punctata]
GEANETSNTWVIAKNVNTILVGKLTDAQEVKALDSKTIKGEKWYHLTDCGSLNHFVKLKKLQNLITPHTYSYKTISSIEGSDPLRQHYGKMTTNELTGCFRPNLSHYISSPLIGERIRDPSCPQNVSQKMKKIKI